MTAKLFGPSTSIISSSNRLTAEYLIVVPTASHTQLYSILV